MSYAVGTIPKGHDRITRLEMKWTVSNNARRSFAFYSPWFGMDPADNLNLVQPVNPWGGDSWSMYTEYFQWEPESNSNSDQYGVTAGQTLHGSIVYDESSDSYNLTQMVVETGDISYQNVPCQDGKKFTIPYVVYEKVMRCADYPPDEIVSFYDILVECDGKDVTTDVKWAAMVKDPNCDFTAHINNSTSIDITWNTKGISKLDHLTDAEIFDYNYHGWATRLPIQRPAE
jgi:hypothetical protein